MQSSTSTVVVVDAHDHIEHHRGRRTFPNHPNQVSHISLGADCSDRFEGYRDRGPRSGVGSRSQTPNGGGEVIYRPPNRTSSSHSLLPGETHGSQHSLNADASFKAPIGSLNEVNVSRSAVPQRRPRGPGKDFARIIEANGFPTGASRRSACADVNRENAYVYDTDHLHTHRKLHPQQQQHREGCGEALNLFERPDPWAWMDMAHLQRHMLRQKRQHVRGLSVAPPSASGSPYGAVLPPESAYSYPEGTDELIGAERKRLSHAGLETRLQNGENASEDDESVVGGNLLRSSAEDESSSRSHWQSCIAAQERRVAALEGQLRTERQLLRELQAHYRGGRGVSNNTNSNSSNRDGHHEEIEPGVRYPQHTLLNENASQRAQRSQRARPHSSARTQFTNGTPQVETDVRGVHRSDSVKDRWCERVSDTTRPSHSQREDGFQAEEALRFSVFPPYRCHARTASSPSTKPFVDPWAGFQSRRCTLPE